MSLLNFLIRVAQKLDKALGLSRTKSTSSKDKVLSVASPEEKLTFFIEVLKATVDSDGDPEVVSLLLRANLDKLDDNFAQILQMWTKTCLSKMELELAQGFAASIINFSDLLQEFPLGDQVSNLEIAIIGYEAAATVFSQQAFPQDWAMTQVSLGNAYRKRIKGNQAENLETAIRCYLAALGEYSREAFPQDWARTQVSLGNAYCNRIMGERAENLEAAIRCYLAGLQEYSRKDFPEQWAQIQNNLGNAYLFRIRGKRAENLEAAIGYFSNALKERNREALPEKWAETQNNLAIAYRNRILGEQAENLEQAIVYYLAALEEYSREKFPQDWAMIQNNLGNIYFFRILGEQAENLEQAIVYYLAALEERTREALPEKWAETQNNLGVAYCERIRGKLTENLNTAIYYFSAALEVYTHQVFPRKYLETKSNLGFAYKDAQQFPDAYTTFATAIDTLESLRSEILSGSGSEQDKQKLAEEWNKCYQTMVEVCLTLDNPTEAVEYAELSKTRNLAELILKRDSKTIFPPDVFAQLEQLRDEIAAGQYQLQNGIVENPKTLAQHLQKLRQQQNELQDRYLSVGYGFNLEQFQANLDAKTVIIEWYVTSTALETFIITCKSLQRLNTSQSSKKLDALIDWNNEYLNTHYNNKIEWINTLTSRLSYLAEILQIEDILKLIPKNCSRLILIPHRYLHLLPLHVLPLANGELLCEKFSNGVGYIPSCQLLQQVQKRKRPNCASIFAIQNPTEDLVYTDLEVESILNLFPSHQVLPYKQATKDALLEQIPKLKDANFIYFSCHGSFNFNSPLDSCLKLAESVDENNNLDLSKCLTLSNLFERDFQLDNCRIVVLSACETGLVDFTNTSDEYISLPSGFIYAGSTCVVSSLWTVNDFSTAFLMIKFSQNIKAAMADNGDFSVAVELQKAQIWLRDTTTAEFKEWASKLKLVPEQAKNIEESLNWFDSNEQPFQNPYWWAAFCATGQ